MTNEEHRRLTVALIRKCGWLADQPDGIEAIVGTVIADTVLVCEGIARIEDYETPAVPLVAEPTWLDSEFRGL